MKKEELTLYRNLLGEIKIRVRTGQHRAALSANAEMVAMYWDIGRMIAARQKAEGWGAGVIPRLAADLKNELPELKGFSARNLKLMVQFYHAYPERLAIGQRTVAQLPPEASAVSRISDCGVSDSTIARQAGNGKLPKQIGKELGDAR